MYGYPGDTSNDFNEFYGSVSFGDATVGMAYSDDYFASTGETTYLYIDYGFDIAENMSIGLHYGTISADDDEAYELAKRLPSSTSKDYGRTFAEIFKEYKYDFYQIDKLLFSPAKVIITTLKTGKTFVSGEINTELVNQSFSK